MKSKKAIFLGLLLGLFVGLLGAIVVILIFSKGNTDIIAGYNYMKSNGSIGKIITLGAIPDLFLGYFLMNKGKEMTARGVILSLFVLTILTLVL